MQIAQNRVAEWTFVSAKAYSDPYRDVQIRLEVDEEGGTRTVPGFWDGGSTWKIRYSSPRTGSFRYRTVCSDASNPDLNGIEGMIEIVPYEGDNPLYRHGPIRRSADSRYLEHEDGKPFFWLADTWWMSLTKRLKWPEEYMEVLNDRVEKGFSVIQIIAGLYPDMQPFDERGANEAGFPWDEEYKTINPAYFQKADDRIYALAEAGLVPCLVGCWGFYLGVAGKEAISKHWDYLMARYGALPVVWCLTGEATMPFYTNPVVLDKDKLAEYQEAIRHEWTDVTRHVKETDPFDRLVTIHPTTYSREMVDDPALLDFEMLQTGHSSFIHIPNTMKRVREAVGMEPRMPFLNSEVCYEGIGYSSPPDIQRFMFWACVLSGACGHTYGANGLWQINGIDKPYGAHPYGMGWGETSWKEAYNLPGSLHVGLSKKLLDRLPWWKFEPHPEWLEDLSYENEFIVPYAAGAPGEARVVFLPFWEFKTWGGVLIRHLEPDINYRAYYYSPITGQEHDLGDVTPSEQGEWRSAAMPGFHDWVLVLEKKEV
ncbi:DUF4038 domain-containing protein [Cohnella soli]|uniref:DUF4038 domain-containing protein n=1 Tax=Cohnella soli TaxID=425005 RepID=A0ABW0I140_9BACL